MIRNILFDMGGVIFIQDTLEAFNRFRRIGIDPDKYMGHFGQKDFFLQVEEGKIGTERFCAELARAAGKESITYADAQHCWLGFMVEAPTERLHDLEELRKDFKLGLLSNTNPFIIDYMDSKGFSKDGKPISDYFDNLFLSYEMKICKPNAGIFLKALEQGGMKADETIFIDDSPINVAAARALGIHAIHVPTNAPWLPLLTAELERLNTES